MPFENEREKPGWSARLDLGFTARGQRTLLTRRAHAGPLHLQKALYPEGGAVCHAIVVHPPGGIVGGDELRLDARVDGGAHALLTTPGAAKWYRSQGLAAHQRVALEIGADGILEWLPQESIVYDGARASIALDVRLESDAVCIVMDVVCFGRPASGERFATGLLELETRITRGDALQWLERARIHGGDLRLDSPIGLGGEPVVGTLLAAAPDVPADLGEECAAVRPRTGRAAVTRVPGLLVARYIGPGCETAREWLAQIWTRVRPRLTGRAAVRPRIWST